MVWYILYLYSMVYHILWYITVWYIPLMWYNMVYTIQVLWYHSCISQLVYHTCDMEHFVCDIPCYITKIGIYHLWYTNHDWYIPVMVGISHDPTFQMTSALRPGCPARARRPQRAAATWMPAPARGTTIWNLGTLWYHSLNYDIRVWTMIS